MDKSSESRNMQPDQGGGTEQGPVASGGQAGNAEARSAVAARMAGATFDENLPGRWVDLQLMPAVDGAGLGPALGWLGGALASGQALWVWPAPAWCLLGLFLVTAVWGRLWARAGGALWVQPAGPSPAQPPEGEGALPYTVPGSLSARGSAALRRAWAVWRAALTTPGSGWAEMASLGALLLLVAGLWGLDALLVALAGLALLGLRQLTRGRPAAQIILAVLGGMAWPWWLGHTAWAALDGESLLISMLWGTAYVGWARLGQERAAGRPLLATDAAQGGVVLFFLLGGRPVAGAFLTLALIGQILVQAALWRAGRQQEVPARTWPLAAIGTILAGLACGGWI